MSRNQSSGPAMDLANMRQNGVRSLDIYCRCGHRAVLNIDAYPGHLAVKSFERRLVCSQCGGRDIEARPNWPETPTAPNLTGVRFQK